MRIWWCLVTAAVTLTSTVRGHHWQFCKHWQPQDSGQQSYMHDSDELISEDSSLLATSYTPNHEDKQRLQLRQSMRKDEIYALESHISQLQARMDSVQKSLDIGNALLSPIRKLPTELLQRIFLYSLPNLPFPNLPDIIPDFEESDHDAGHITRARLRLSHVCHRWRITTLDSTQLWTTIALVQPIPSDRVIAQWFKNSGTRPLDVSFQPSLLGFSPVCLNFLRNNMGRIRCLLAYDEVVDTAILLYLFPPGCITEAPVMEALRIRSKVSFDYIGHINAPSLIHLQEEDDYISHRITPTLSLRTFTGGSHSLHFLIQCSRLKEMILYLTKSLLQLEHVTFPVLQSLSLVPRNWVHNSAILQFVLLAKIPMLKRLEVWFSSKDADNTSGVLLDAISQEYGSNLQHLKLGCARLEGFDMEQIFSNLPHLETLSFSYGLLDETLFDTLMPRPSLPPSLWLCPRLSQLTIFDSTILSPLAIASLVMLVRERTTVLGRQIEKPGYLSSIEVLGCVGLDSCREKLEELAFDHCTFKYVV